MAREAVRLDNDSLFGLTWQCEMYCASWLTLVTEEVKSVYGPHEPLDGSKGDLQQSGSCVFGVEFQAVEGSLTQVRADGKAHAMAQGGNSQRRVVGGSSQWQSSVSRTLIWTL